MSIVKQEDWEKWVDNNKDPYGKACILVAEEVMRLLDTPKYQEFDPHTIICDADKNTNAGGITGFMAGCIAQTISHCHSRGEEFKKKWNSQRDEVINPYLEMNEFEKKITEVTDAIKLAIKKRTG